MKSSLLISVLILFCFSCGKDEIAPSSTCEKESHFFQIMDQIEICYDDTVVLQNEDIEISYHFSNLVEDSRCPTHEGVACILEGRAVIELIIDNNDTVLLANKYYERINDTLYSTTLYKSFIAKLVKVNPMPTLQLLEPNRYSIILEVNNE